jgi:hypothetical protein
LLTGGELDADALNWIPSIAPGSREIEWLRFAGRALTKQSDAQARSVLIGRDGQPQPALTLEEIRLAGQKLRPNTSVTVDWLKNAGFFRHYTASTSPPSSPNPGPVTSASCCFACSAER